MRPSRLHWQEDTGWIVLRIAFAMVAIVAGWTAATWLVVQAVSRLIR